MRKQRVVKPDRWLPPQVCAVCDYDIADLDFSRVNRCPECGSPISVRIVPPVRPYQDFAAAVGFMASVFLMCLLVKGLLDGPVKPGPAAAGVLIVGTVVAICIYGIRILSTRPGPPWLRTVGVLMALAPIILSLAGCVLAGMIW